MDMCIYIYIYIYICVSEREEKQRGRGRETRRRSETGRTERGTERTRNCKGAAVVKQGEKGEGLEERGQVGYPP